MSTQVRCGWTWIRNTAPSFDPIFAASLLSMASESQRNEHLAQQLVRYEALFKLLDDIQTLENIEAIARHIAAQWKYFANVAAWRMVALNDSGFQAIDGFRGEAHIENVLELTPWDQHHWKLQRPRLIRMADPLEGPAPPEHLAGKAIAEIEILPFVRMGRCIGLLSVAARHQPFSELDQKFIRIFGSYFADRVSDILLRRQATEALINKATRDALTGLLNRGAIIERLGNQLALSKHAGKPLSVILADIDFFKVINDSHGHLAGDAVLREVSRRLQAQTLSGDSVGRYGGEEFLFVLYPCSAEEVVKAAERLRRAIAEVPVAIGGVAPKDLQVTISLGASSTAGQENARMEALLKQADEALYRSKAGGRNRVTAGHSG